MTAINYPVGTLTDNSGNTLTSATVTITSVLAPVSPFSVIATPGAVVNYNSANGFCSVTYDAEVHGEAVITLSVIDLAAVVTGLNASPSVYCSLNSGLTVNVLTSLLGMISAGAFTAPALVNAGSGGGASAAAIATAVWTDLFSSTDFSTVASAGAILKELATMISSGVFTAPALANAPSGGGGGGGAGNATALPATSALVPGTWGEALAAARALAMGKRLYVPPGSTTGTMSLYGADGTLLITQAVAVDSAGNVISVI